ncbi:MAG: NB-ARC domain-containing protein [Chloroflexaceae bacterium]
MPDESTQPAHQITGEQNQAITTGNICDVSGTVAVGQHITQIQTTHVPEPARALHQLRAPVNDFIGREQEIEQLVQMLSAGDGTVATITGIRGMGGIGKTALADATAQRLIDTFPDAQIVLQLRGATATPLSPEAALQQVLRAFEPAGKLPEDLSTLERIYRSHLHGNRVLVLADDACDEAQVRSLLPPPGSALLITSRQRFRLRGMEPLDLGSLPPTDAEALLLQICPRIGEHASQLARLCGYLPLALQISASVLSNDATLPVVDYVERLTRERLQHLRDPDGDPDDPQASVAASLALSYAALPTAAQVVLAKLSIFAGSFDREALVAVVQSVDEVEKIAGLLYRRNLLDYRDERYALHDLVREFATAQLDANIAWTVQQHAWHYLRVAQRAGKLYAEGGEKMKVGVLLFDCERDQIDAG